MVVSGVILDRPTSLKLSSSCFAHGVPVLPQGVFDTEKRAQKHVFLRNEPELDSHKDGWKYLDGKWFGDSDRNFNSGLFGGISPVEGIMKVVLSLAFLVGERCQRILNPNDSVAASHL